MFDESQWQAWAEREKQRTPGLRVAREPARVEPSDAPMAIERIDRGVTELRRRNRALSDELLAHYGLPVLGRPVGVRPGAIGRKRNAPDPKVDLAKRWVEKWSAGDAH